MPAQIYARKVVFLWIVMKKVSGTQYPISINEKELKLDYLILKNG